MSATEKFIQEFKAGLAAKKRGDSHFSCPFLKAKDRIESMKRAAWLRGWQKDVS